jgi:hypothetical protein
MLHGSTLLRIDESIVKKTNPMREELYLKVKLITNWSVNFDMLFGIRLVEAYTALPGTITITGLV